MPDSGLTSDLATVGVFWGLGAAWATDVANPFSDPPVRPWKSPKRFILRATNGDKVPIKTGSVVSTALMGPSGSGLPASECFVKGTDPGTRTPETRDGPEEGSAK